MRVLVASTQGAGHLGPLVPFLEALGRRGDDVLVVVPPALAPVVADRGWPCRIGADPPEDELEAVWRRVPTASREQAAVLVNRELFGRLDTAAMLPTVEGACREWAPDLVLRDPCEYASAVAADRLGIRHAQVAISLASVEHASLDLAAPALEPYAPGIVERIRASPYLTRFPPSLDPPVFADTRRFRSAETDAAQPLPDWWRGDDAPLVYVTFGTVAPELARSGSIYRAAVDAMVGIDARVLVTTGRGTTPDGLGVVPENVHVEPWVPQDDVLAQASLVVCHGGSGTTFGALAAGVPVVAVPLFADQPANAERVAAAGAGVLVRPDGGDIEARIATADLARRIRAAVVRVLTDTSYRDGAARVAAELRTLPGVEDVLSAVTGGVGRS